MKIAHLRFNDSGGIDSYVSNLSEAKSQYHETFVISREYFRGHLDQRTIKKLNEFHLILIHASSLSEALFRKGIKPYVGIVIHGDSSHYYNWCERHGDWADLIVVVSLNMLKKLRDRHQLKALHLGPTISLKSKAIDSPSRRRTMIFVGREERLKGVQSLPIIDSELTRCGFELEWKIILGSRPEEVTQFRDWINKNPKRIAIHEKLSKEAVEAHLIESAALLLPSLTEGHPLVVLEALKNGIPPLTFEYAEGCRAHFPIDLSNTVAPSANELELSNRIAKVLNWSDSERREWQGNARKFILEMHNPCVESNALIAFLSNRKSGWKPAFSFFIYPLFRRILITLGAWR